MIKRLLPFLLLLFASPAIAANFEILDGSAVVTRQWQKTQMVKKAKLYEGDRLQASPEVQILGDFGFFFAVSRGELAFPVLRREGCGVRNVIVYSGFFSITTRPRTCKTSEVKVISAKTGISYTLQSGAKINDVDGASAIAVSHGLVTAENPLGRVDVPAGYGSINRPNQPPGQPIKLSLELTQGRPERWGAGYILPVMTNPLNSIEVQGAKAFTNRFFLRLPKPGNSIQVTVRSKVDPNQQRTYHLPRKELRF
ncbi:MAG TPA: hypothetical protein V6D19_05735 [Stenomitos sp.]